jgi:cytochrome c556
MKATRWGGLLAAVVAAGVIGGLAEAQTLNQDIITIRQAGMSLQQGAVDAMVATVKANGDVKPYARAAEAIAFWANQIPLAFPPGSDKGHDTKAKPEIWSDPAGFKKDSDDLAAAAEKLQAAAKAGDTAAFADDLKAAGATCGACHRTYRVRSSG